MFIGSAIFYSQGAKIIEQSVMTWKYGTKINSVYCHWRGKHSTNIIGVPYCWVSYFFDDDITSYYVYV